MNKTYDPNIIADELGVIFGLALHPNMIRADGVNYEAGSGTGYGLLRVELQRKITTEQWHEIFRRARIPEDRDREIATLRSRITELELERERGDA